MTQNVLIINAHQKHAFSEGKLNGAAVDFMKEKLTAKGYDVKTVSVDEDYDADEQVKLHLWADTVILQTPVYWMGLPWKAKKYMDEVHTASMGHLWESDGRNEEEPSKNYGTGGMVKGKKYMLSFTFNAPTGAFNDPKEYLFEGRSLDDLFMPQHMIFRFFGMEALESFAFYDVMKNPTIEADFERLEKHLDAQFTAVTEAAA